METITNAGLYLFYLLSNSKTAEPQTDCKGAVKGLRVLATMSINTNMIGGENIAGE